MHDLSARRLHGNGSDVAAAEGESTARSSCRLQQVLVKREMDSIGRPGERSTD